MGVAPDGSPVAVYATLPALGEAELVASVVPRGATILELGSGAGRVTHALVAEGYEVTAVDESDEMLAHVRGAETVRARIETLDVGRTFDCVLLASHFVNVPDAASRRALLGTCARHVAADGVVLVETYPVGLDWTPGRERAIDGVTIRLVEAKRDGAHLRATMEYEVGGERWRQPFEAVLLDERDLARELARVALRFDGWLDEERGWCVARRA